MRTVQSLPAMDKAQAGSDEVTDLLLPHETPAEGVPHPEVADDSKSMKSDDDDSTTSQGQDFTPCTTPSPSQGQTAQRENRPYRFAPSSSLAAENLELILTVLVGGFTKADGRSQLTIDDWMIHSLERSDGLDTYLKGKTHAQTETIESLDNECISQGQSLQRSRELLGNLRNGELVGIGAETRIKDEKLVAMQKELEGFKAHHEKVTSQIIEELKSKDDEIQRLETGLWDEEEEEEEEEEAKWSGPCELAREFINQEGGSEDDEGFQNMLQEFNRLIRADIDRDGASQVLYETREYLASTCEHRERVEAVTKFIKDALGRLEEEFEDPQSAGKTTLENGAGDLDIWAKDLERREQKLEQVHSLVAEMLIE